MPLIPSVTQAGMPIATSAVSPARFETIPIRGWPAERARRRIPPFRWRRFERGENAARERRERWAIRLRAPQPRIPREQTAARLPFDRGRWLGRRRRARLVRWA